MKTAENEDGKLIIGLHGYAQTGKDTFAKRLINKYGFERIAFADPLREAMYVLNPYVSTEYGNHRRLADIVDEFGWDESKIRYKEIRRLLQIFGTEVCRKMFNDNFWIDLAINKIKTSSNKRFVITDCRFDNEVSALKSMNAWMIKIERPGIGPINDHISDKGLPDSLFYQIVNNDKTIEELNSHVDTIIGKILFKSVAF